MIENGIRNRLQTARFWCGQRGNASANVTSQLLQSVFGYVECIGETGLHNDVGCFRYVNGVTGRSVRWLRLAGTSFQTVVSRIIVRLDIVVLDVALRFWWASRLQQTLQCFQYLIGHVILDHGGRNEYFVELLVVRPQSLNELLSFIDHLSNGTEDID